jgi:hypothetical protein
MGVALLLFNISRPQRLTELSNVTQMASRTLAGNSQCIVSKGFARRLNLWHGRSFPREKVVSLDKVKSVKRGSLKVPGAPLRIKSGVIKLQRRWK